MKDLIRDRRRWGRRTDHVAPLVLPAVLLLAAIGQPMPARAQLQAELAPPEQRQVTVAAPPAVERAPATVSRLSNLEEAPKGFWAHSSYDDVVLRNDLAQIVIGDVPDRAEGSQPANQFRHGAVLDATVSPATPENLQLFTPNTRGLRGITLIHDGIETYTQNDGSAVAVVTSHDNEHPFLTAETTYVMYKDMPGVEITTTLTNTDENERIPLVQPSDYIAWGGMTVFIPGTGWLPFGSDNREVDFLAARRHDVWMVLAPDRGLAELRHSTGVSSLIYGTSGAMLPGESRIYRRWLLVGTEDPAHIYSLILQRRQTDTGTLIGKVIRKRQTPDGATVEVGPLPYCNVRILPIRVDEWSPDRNKEMLMKPFSIVRTDENGVFDCLLPVGEYHVYAAPEARLAPRPNVGQVIRKNQITAVDFGVSPPSRLVFEIVDDATGQRIPGKLSIEPLRGTRMDEELGPPGSALGPNVVYSSHGVGAVELPAGNFRITASRGPEYHSAEERVKLARVNDTNVVFRLKRAFETPGWISADIGVRTDASSASRVTPEARVTSALAEGVDWLVTGDPTGPTDLSAAVQAINAGKWIKTSPGFRFPGEAKPFRGDFLVFPTSLCGEAEPADFAGLLDLQETSEVLAGMRELCPDAVILLSRPIWPTFGYLASKGLDFQDPLLPDGSWSRNFDAIQIWEGKRQQTFAPGYAVYQQLLQDGTRVTAFANSNSFGTWMEEVGYPRVYIRSSTDDPAKIDPAELADNIKKGLVSVTNGPFITYTVNGEPEGSTVTDTDGIVDLDLRVHAANWVQVSAISIQVNGQFTRRIILPSGNPDPNSGQIFPDPRKEDASSVLRIRLTRDSVLDILAEGSLERPMDPVNPLVLPTTDTEVTRGQYPVAVSAPVFIDADGDGIVTLTPPEDTEEIDLMGLPQDPPF